MNCFEHRNRLTVDRCTGCNRTLCRECVCMDVDGLRCRACAMRRLRAQMEAAAVVAGKLDSRRRLASWAGLGAGLLVGVVVAFVLPYRFPPAQTGTLATLALPLALLLGYMVWAGTLVMSSWAKVWRRVTPEPSSGLGTGGPEPGMMFSLAGITLGLTVVVVLMTINTVALIPVTFGMLAVAVILATLGMGTVRRRFARPKSATFDGQVVARWQERVEDTEGRGIVGCAAIDDGERAWIFHAPHVYRGVAVGDLVEVTVSPRTGDLQGLTVTARR